MRKHAIFNLLISDGGTDSLSSLFCLKRINPTSPTKRLQTQFPGLQ